MTTQDKTPYEVEIVERSAAKTSAAVKDYYSPVVRRPNWHYEVVGKKTLLGRLGLAKPGHGWDIVGIRKVYDEEEAA